MALCNPVRSSGSRYRIYSCSWRLWPRLRHRGRSRLCGAALLDRDAGRGLCLLFVIFGDPDIMKDIEYLAGQELLLARLARWGPSAWFSGIKLYLRAPYLGNQSAFKKGRSRICKLLEVNTMIFGHCIKNGRSARFGVESRISRVYHPFEAILIILYRVYPNPQLPNPRITF